MLSRGGSVQGGRQGRQSLVPSPDSLLGLPSLQKQMQAPWKQPARKCPALSTASPEQPPAESLYTVSPWPWAPLPLPGLIQALVSWLSRAPAVSPPEPQVPHL